MSTVEIPVTAVHMRDRGAATSGKRLRRPLQVEAVCTAMVCRLMGNVQQMKTSGKAMLSGKGLGEAVAVPRHVLQARRAE